MNLPSGLWSGLHFCMLVFVFGVDYIFAFLSMGGLFILKTYWGKIEVNSITSTMQLGWIKCGLQGIYTFLLNIY